MVLRSALPQNRVSIWQKDNQYIQIIMKTIIDDSRCWMDNILKSASTEHPPFVGLWVWCLNSDLVTVMHTRHIDSFCRQKRQQHAHHPILGICFNRASMNVNFASCVIYLPIGCKHPFMRYWQPVLPKTTATCSLPHPENECQWSVTGFESCIFGDQGIARIFVLIMESLTPLIGKNTIYQR